jgi:hypothetical protein
VPTDVVTSASLSMDLRPVATRAVACTAVSTDATTRWTTGDAFRRSALGGGAAKAGETRGDGRSGPPA